MSLAETHEFLDPTMLHQDSVAPYQNFIESTPTFDTKNGERTYDLLCLAMQDTETGEVIIVRKCDAVDSSDPTDWLVVRFLPDSESPVFETVLSSNKYTTKMGDRIELEIAARVSHHGPHMLCFGVDPLYRPDGKVAELTHRKYYGRGVGTEPEKYLDARYDKDISGNSIQDTGEYIAEVIQLDEQRRRRRPLGFTAIAGSQ